MLMKNKKTFIGALTGACLAMAMTMPSCPGQQAMQQQIDTLTTSQQEMATKVRGLETQVKAAAASSEESKKIIEQLNAAVMAQKGALDNLTASVQQMDAKIAAASTKPGKGASKPAPKRKH